jgi:hypothetical protein
LLPIALLLLSCVLLLLRGLSEDGARQVSPHSRG